MFDFMQATTVFVEAKTCNKTIHATADCTERLKDANRQKDANPAVR